MTIIHEKWGEVAGVECQIPQSRWWKQGANYYFGDGWREKVEERWEEDSSYLSTSRAYLAFSLAANRRWAAVERYALPDDWRHQSINEGAENLTTWVEQFKRPCLIIERKVEP